MNVRALVRDLAAVAALSTLLSPAPMWAGEASCPGDCNGDGAVTVNELIVGVNIALGTTMVSACPQFDRDDDGAVSISEIIGAVQSALSGCASAGGTVVVRGRVLQASGGGSGISAASGAEVTGSVDRNGDLGMLQAGVNQMVFHGFSYATAPNVRWPGFAAFSPFSGVGYGEAWGPRQPTWKHVGDISGYFARTDHRKDRDAVGHAAQLENSAHTHIQIGGDAGAQRTDRFRHRVFLLTGLAISIQRLHQNFERNDQTRFSSLSGKLGPCQSPH